MCCNVLTSPILGLLNLQNGRISLKTIFMVRILWVKNVPIAILCCMPLVYSYNTQGLASRCVELVINRLKFRKQLLKAKIKEGNSKRYKLLSDLYDIYEGEVLYKDEVEILNLTKQRIKVNQKEVDNEIFDSYFNPFSFDSYLNLMLLKRNAFRHESEVRIFRVCLNFKLIIC